MRARLGRLRTTDKAESFSGTRLSWRPHGKHLAFDPKADPPLSNLFVQIANRVGVETTKFGASTRAELPGLEAAG